MQLPELGNSEETLSLALDVCMKRLYLCPLWFCQLLCSENEGSGCAALRESASARVASSINWESIQGVYTELWGETKEQLDRRSELLLAHFQH